MKNGRNLLLNRKRSLLKGGKSISIRFLRRVLDSELNGWRVKGAGYLSGYTLRALFPSSFDKMDVSLALKVFKRESIAALQKYYKDSQEAASTIEYVEAYSTIFLEILLSGEPFYKHQWIRKRS